MPHSKTIFDEFPLQARPQSASADERSDARGVGKKLPQERKEQGKRPVAGTVEREKRREVPVGEEQKPRLRCHDVDFVRTEKRRRVPTPGEIADRRLTRRAAG